ncbi:gamma-glutamylcyclotransferase family protein [Pandoraea anhela]|uniref:Gamma-glutamylcyclotransferase n=1 Tax=Pandoraea anhela TaxID=2508295 RepID=A0A5E4VTC5_9BURK|nr:gamma-glutamylcyclotransferase family protein [Pandoraea anhela]VVE15618.1 gamma-glutamylcyclotransferase [Pandoraea anhela]
MTTAVHDAFPPSRATDTHDAHDSHDAAVHVFVYGTLRAGEINDMMRAAARHGIAAPAYVGTSMLGGRLYDFGQYPGMVLDARQAGQAEGVTGDIYRISPALIPVLDEIEAVYPGEAGLFVREVRDVMCDGAAYACIVYPVSESAVSQLPQISGGDWVAYRRARDASVA